MTFASRITRVPLAFDPDNGRLAVSGVDWGDPAMAELAHGAAGCSPYLRALMLRERDWAAGLSAQSPEATMAELLSRLDDAPFDPRALGALLRRIKGQVGLLCAMADLGGVWSLEQVTGALGGFADRAMQVAVDQLVRTEAARGTLPGLTADTVTGAAGMVVLAMGKLGAHELNYSSDIDLICLFDETRFDPAEQGQARGGFVRVTRALSRMLSDKTAQGYVFRTDLRLRPEPSVTPVCLSIGAARAYYESVGRTWERAAFIKARAAAGDIRAGREFLDQLVPFVWRRNLDYTAIHDTHEMRLKIRANKWAYKPGQSGIALAGHNVKLGAGGIREIEFFAQTHQLIAGGRDPSLRARATCAALGALASAGWVSQDMAGALSDHYRALREVEHRVQMVADAQTHALPQDDAGFDRLARFCGASDTEAFRNGLLARFRDVAARMDPFYTRSAGTPLSGTGGADGAQPGRDPALAATRPGVNTAMIPPQLPASTDAVAGRWLSYPALRSPRAVDLFERLLPGVLTRLATAARPEEALTQFDRFLQGLPAGVQLFALFEANPRILDLLVDICATAPGLARYLSRNTAVLDSVLDGGFFADWPGQQALRRALHARLAELTDYEKQLDEARRWKKDWHFRIGVHHLRNLIDAEEAGQRYAQLARAVLSVLMPVVEAQLARRHGSAPGKGAIVLAMGSLGAGRLNAASDLDMIVIFDADGVETSTGPRPMSARLWYARLTQALITALSAPTAEGRLYEADMRLRPSGRQGPVATALAAFRAYQLDEAWTWEHLALTRAHPVAGAGPGASSLCTEVEAFRGELVTGPVDKGAVISDVADMRARLAREKPGHGVWDVKSGPGGMMDIELAAQSMAWVSGATARRVPEQLQAGVACGLLPETDRAGICSCYALLVTVNQGARLVTQRLVAPEDMGQSALDFLLRATGHASADALEQALARARALAAAQISSYLERCAGTTADGGTGVDAG